jgi:hypothetical protein
MLMGNSSNSLKLAEFACAPGAFDIRILTSLMTWRQLSDYGSATVG